MNFRKFDIPLTTFQQNGGVLFDELLTNDYGEFTDNVKILRKAFHASIETSSTPPACVPILIFGGSAADCGSAVLAAYLWKARKVIVFTSSEKESDLYDVAFSGGRKYKHSETTLIKKGIMSKITWLEYFAVQCDHHNPKQDRFSLGRYNCVHICNVSNLVNSGGGVEDMPTEGFDVIVLHGNLGKLRKTILSHFGSSARVVVCISETLPYMISHDCLTCDHHNCPKYAGFTRVHEDGIWDVIDIKMAQQTIARNIERYGGPPTPVKVTIDEEKAAKEWGFIISSTSTSAST